MGKSCLRLSIRIYPIHSSISANWPWFGRKHSHVEIGGDYQKTDFHIHEVYVRHGIIKTSKEYSLVFEFIVVSPNHLDCQHG